MRKTTPGDDDLWEKMIYDNKASSLLCLYTARNKTIPDPDIRFLEQCTFNIILGNTNPYYYVLERLHSVRSSYHSAFIIVRSEECSSYYYLKGISARPLIFYYLPFCKYLSNSSFPHGYIDFQNAGKMGATKTYSQSTVTVNLRSEAQNRRFLAG